MRELRKAAILVPEDNQCDETLFRGEHLSTRLERTLREYFDEVTIIACTSDQNGKTHGLDDALEGLEGEHLFVADGDAPFLQYSLMRYLYEQRKGCDLISLSDFCSSALYTGVYSKNYLRLLRGSAILEEMEIRQLEAGSLPPLDPAGLSLLKVTEAKELAGCSQVLAEADGPLPPALSFVAKSGTGKTTLLEKVIARMTERGWRVGSVKHDAHRFEIDHEGKDSWRLTRAGASPMLVSSPEKMAMVRPNPAGEMPLEELIRRYLTEADIVITEGYKTGPLPKIEVNRTARSEQLLCVDDEGSLTDERLRAVVSDGTPQVPVPLLSLDDVDAICDFIENTFLCD